MIELQTERMILRTPTLADIESIRDYVDSADCSWGGYGIVHPATVEEAEKWVRKCGAKLDEEACYAFLLVRRDDGAIMGNVMLNRDAIRNVGDIGYIVGEKFRGHGYAFEAATELLRFAFEDIELHRVYATCWARNERSAHILEKLGFLREGVLREHALKWGKYEDDAYYGMLRREGGARNEKNES